MPIYEAAKSYRFPYTEVDGVGENSAFPGQSTVLRPYITVHLSKGGSRVGTMAVIDSGADFCLFPSSWAEVLGITIPNVRWSEFRDATGNLRTAYFDVVELAVVNPYTHEDSFMFQTDVGFSSELEDDGVAYLGHHGFFSNCRVLLNYREGFFEIMV
jgi:hypothetical protein